MNRRAILLLLVLALAASTFFLVSHNASEEGAIERVLREGELAGREKRRLQV